MNTSNSGLIIVNENFSVVLSHAKPSRVILSVPHDGLIANDFSGLFQERTCGPKVRDMYVWPIANDIVQNCLRLGMTVDAVRCLMSRTYVDVNREMSGESNLAPDTLGQTALDDPDLVTVYKQYYGELDRLIQASIREYGAENILLLDLHGFNKQPPFADDWEIEDSGPDEWIPWDLFLGTACRATINHGEVDRQFARAMWKRKYSVFLPKERPVFLNGDPYSAGHITRLYAGKYGINAMQIEIFSSFRQRESNERGRKLAADIAEFLSANYR